MELLFNCEESEAHIDLFVDSQYLDLHPLDYSLITIIIQKLNLSFDGYHVIEGTGFLELNNDDLYLDYNLKEIDWNPVNYENVVIDREKYIEENMKFLKGNTLLLSHEYNNEVGFNNDLLLQAQIEKEVLDAQNYIRPSEKELWNRLNGQEKENNTELVISEKLKNLPKKAWWKFW